MSNEFSGLKFARRFQPDDGCDHTALIVWGMRRRANIRNDINAPRPVPVKVIEVKANDERKSPKAKRKKSAGKPASDSGGTFNAPVGSVRKRAATLRCAG
ncbi:hypothetical protein P4910_20260 [Pantoea stewartii]|uniref:hypothetical protein n=1 Tax=Pantoea stewartii TaxID=66269 RepID=UPI0023F6A118|nr:hypothetical protein [Pantoea stewartii]MDF7787795.1 hypothetical protein [Pantoea stewartii]